MRKPDPLDVVEDCPSAWGFRLTVSRDERPIRFALTERSWPGRMKQAVTYAKANLDFDGYLDFGPGKGYVEVAGGMVRAVMDRDVQPE